MRLEPREAHGCGVGEEWHRDTQGVGFESMHDLEIFKAAISLEAIATRVEAQGLQFAWQRKACVSMDVSKTVDVM